MNLRNILRRVPQPYKRWIARPIGVAFVLLLVPLAAALDIAGWVKRVTGAAIIDLWEDIGTW